MNIRDWFWWLPTKEEQHKYLEDDARHYDEEIPRRLTEHVEAMEALNKLEDELVQSLSHEQHDKWIELKSAAQKAQLTSTRLNYAQEFRGKQYSDRLKGILS